MKNHLSVKSDWFIRFICSSKILLKDQVTQLRVNICKRFLSFRGKHLKKSESGPRVRAHGQNQDCVLLNILKIVYIYVLLTYRVEVINLSIYNHLLLPWLQDWEWSGADIQILPQKVQHLSPGVFLSPRVCHHLSTPQSKRCREDRKLWTSPTLGFASLVSFGL